MTSSPLVTYQVIGFQYPIFHRVGTVNGKFQLRLFLLLLFFLKYKGWNFSYVVVGTPMFENITPVYPQLTLQLPNLHSAHINDNNYLWHVEFKLLPLLLV